MSTFVRGVYSVYILTLCRSEFMVFYLRRFTPCITHTIQGPLQIGTRVTNVGASKVQDCMVYHGQYTVSKPVDCIAYELFTFSSYTAHTDMHDTKMFFIKE